MRITIDYNGSVLTCKVSDISEKKQNVNIFELSPLKQSVAIHALRLAIKGYEQDKKLKKLGFKDKV